jgi:hypothetical protein
MKRLLYKLADYIIAMGLLLTILACVLLSNGCSLQKRIARDTKKGIEEHLIDTSAKTTLDTICPKIDTTLNDVLADDLIDSLGLQNDTSKSETISSSKRSQSIAKTKTYQKKQIIKTLEKAESNDLQLPFTYTSKDKKTTFTISKDASGKIVVAETTHQTLIEDCPKCEQPKGWHKMMFCLTGEVISFLLAFLIMFFVGLALMVKRAIK